MSTQDLLSNLTFLKLPFDFVADTNNKTAMAPFVQSNLSDIIQISVGPKEDNGGLQPCITYNPPGPYKPGLTPERNVSTECYLVETG